MCIDNGQPLQQLQNINVIISERPAVMDVSSDKRVPSGSVPMHPRGPVTRKKCRHHPPNRTYLVRSVVCAVRPYLPKVFPLAHVE